MYQTVYVFNIAEVTHILSYFTEFLDKVFMIVCMPLVSSVLLSRSPVMKKKKVCFIYSNNM